MKRWSLYAGLLGLSLLLAACSLAGDVTPPPGANRLPINVPSAGDSVPAPVQPVDIGPGYPASKPSIAQGAAIFAQHCAACHGVTGKGDGEMAAKLMSERTEPLPDFSSREHTSAHTPAELFQVVTQGRLEKLMPPWQNKLSEAERWSAVAFLYTLSAPSAQLEAGQTIYAAQCAACHGNGGLGDGPEAPSADLPDFTHQAFMAAMSQADFFAAVTSGNGIPGHVFQDKLTDDERWAVVNFVRAFSFDASGADSAPVAAVAENKGQVTGAVTNGSQNATAPLGLEITLRGFDNFAQTLTLTTTTDAKGQFTFTDVPYLADRQFLLTVLYRDLTYSSDIFNFTASPQVNDLALAVYDTTGDRSVLTIERIHIVFDFSAEAGQANVGELVLITNASDKTFVPTGGQAFEIPLPPGASGLQVQNQREGVDYIVTAQGFTLNTPIRPGPSAAQISFAFRLPYNQGLNFEQKVLYPVNTVNVMVPEVGVRAEGAALQDEGPQTIQGSSFRAYNAVNVLAGETIAFQLTGQPSAATTDLARTPQTGFDPLGLALGLGALGLALAGAGYWWYRRNASTETADDDYEALLQAVADLDDDFEQGALEPKKYERERAQLKGKLRGLAQRR